jgi:sporulation protein YlmC with PRC-barrel domain
MKRKIEDRVDSMLGAKQSETTMRSILLAGAAVLALSQVAMAQEPNAQDSNNTPTASQITSNLGSNLRSMLQKSGYTGIRVAPTSFMVRAKDSDGNQVVMSVSPNSFAEITDMNTTNGPTTGAGKSNSTTGADRFVTIAGNDDLSSKVVGLDIYNDNQQDIGQIKDIALNQNGQTQAYILSVGGFLGMGEHYVAVNPASVKVTYNEQDKKWHATMNATSAQLKVAPEFKYSGRWVASRT